MKLVLILEDDPASLSVLKWVLERDYRVVSADTPEEALAICQSESLDLFVADNLLRSHISGLRTLWRAHALLPNLPLVVVSGTPPEGWRDEDFECFESLVKSARFDFLHKPFTAEEFRNAASALSSDHWNPQGIERLYASALMHRASGESWRHRFRP